MSELVFTAEQLEQKAKCGEDMPKGLNSAQQGFFQNMQRLVYNYRLGIVDADKARDTKKELYNTFYKENRMCRIWENHLRIRLTLGDISKKAYKGNCENCKRMIRIFDGLEV